MKVRALICLILAFALSAVTVSAQSGAAKGKGRVKGSVKDMEGKPITDVTVRFESDKLLTSFEVKTDERGGFMVSGMAGGPWNVDFRKEGYKTRKIATSVSELSYNHEVDVQLEPAAPAAQQAAPKEKTPGVDLVEEANALRDSKDYSGAIAKYEAALQANPALFVVYGDIGRIYREQGDADKAVDAYNKLLEKDPANSEARLELADTLLSKGRVDDAKKTLAALDMTGISNPYTIYNLGVGMMNAKQPEEALKYWEKAVTLDPKMTDAYLQMGFAYYSMKNMDKAKEAFQKVIAIDPGSDNAKNAQEMLDNMK